MVRRSGYMDNQAWFEIMLREIKVRLDELEKYGVKFERDEQGKLKTDAIRGQSKGFMYLARGIEVIEVVAREARRKGVRFLERISIVDLLTFDGSHPTRGNVVGAIGLHTRSGRLIILKAKAVVIATGLISSKSHNFSTDNITGDGYAMAFRAGAEITGLEFSAQPFGTWNRKFSASGPQQFQHGGARLINRLGEEFLFKYPGASKQFVRFEGHFDQSAICRAIAIQDLEGRGPCYFDCRGWSQEKFDRMGKILPSTMRAFNEPGVGVDLKTEPVQTNPLVGGYGISCQSGIKINVLAETAVGGLYAAGAAAYYGGEPGPQSLCIVGGYRAGENTAKWAKEIGFADDVIRQALKLREAIYAPLGRSRGANPDDVYDSINKLVTPWGASLFKHQKRITDVLNQISRMAEIDLATIKADDIHELIKAAEARNFVLLMKLYNLVALERKESRMFHLMEEYPYTDDRYWRKWILLKNDGSGRVSINTFPASLGCSAIVPESLSKKPAQAAYKLEKK